MATLAAVRRRRARRSPAALAALVALAGSAASSLGCASLLGSEAPPITPGSWHWFAEPEADDPWIASIRDWQTREQHDVDATVPPVSVESERPLADAFRGFRSAQRRALAHAVAEWIQEQAKRHFAPDVGRDHWPTFREVLVRGTDDCDGLALLTYRLLREFGFGPAEVYQAIVQNDGDGRLHMVTLWFEDPADPWVIDPTAAMVKPMLRMSQVPGWRPLQLFSDTDQFAVSGHAPPLAPSPAASEPAAR